MAIIYFAKTQVKSQKLNKTNNINKIRKIVNKTGS